MHSFAKTHLCVNVAIENSCSAITICTTTEKYRAHFDLDVFLKISNKIELEQLLSSFEDIFYFQCCVPCDNVPPTEATVRQSLVPCALSVPWLRRTHHTPFSEGWYDMLFVFLFKWIWNTRIFSCWPWPHPHAMQGGAFKYLNYCHCTGCLAGSQ